MSIVQYRNLYVYLKLYTTRYLSSDSLPAPYFEEQLRNFWSLNSFGWAQIVLSRMEVSNATWFMLRKFINLITHLSLSLDSFKIAAYVLMRFLIKNSLVWGDSD
ncbi:hypothetical protein J3Q64DRAFT_1702361 [Phycomyces blakesleeanus]|uniref:Uncharacterized protein n=1 Tax=Phycomyces blakesleeanus TaxID=4837 RepID=A0ABR3APE0_PHYBL